jgi:regulator of protease activity HflC (stomatin/prohibitin superfamily)
MAEVDVVLISLLILAIIAAVVIVANGIRIVRPYEQAVYIRLGRFVKILDQGFNYVTPLISEVIKLDLRTVVLDVPRQEVITKDNSPTNVDAIIYIKVIDPSKAFFQVQNYRAATVYLAQTTLRSIIGDMELDEILSNREKINLHLRDVLDEATDKWGVKVEAVEIREVDPAPKVKQAMEEQTSAERLRRAAVLKADGAKKAEGLRQAKILEAEGERMAIILQSQGEAQKLRILSVGAAPLDSKALTVLTLDTIKALGNGQSTKFIFPMELTRLVEGVSEYLGSSRLVPDRAISSMEEIERSVGKADDVLGPIPKPDELRRDLRSLEEVMEKEKAEMEQIADPRGKGAPSKNVPAPES